MSVLFEYLINEAATGAASGSLTNNGVGGGTAALEAATGFEWAEAAAGRYLQFPPTKNSTAASVRVNPIPEAARAALSGATQFEIVFKLTQFVRDQTLFTIRSGNPVVTFLNISSLGTADRIRLAFNGQFVDFPTPLAGGAYAIRVDTAAADLANRVRMWRDGEEIAQVAGATVAQNSTIASTLAAGNDARLALGNTVFGDYNIVGRLHYFALLDGNQIDGAAVTTALLANDDTSPLAAEPEPETPVLSAPSVTDLQPTTATANITTDIGSGTLYALYSTNATELAAAIKGGESQAVSVTGEQSIALTGLPLGEAGYVHFIQTADGQDSNIVSYGFTTAAKMTQSTTATIALPAGYSMVELSGELYTRGLTQLQRSPQPGWQMIGQTSEIEWAVDGSAQVKKIDAAFNAWVIDEFGKLSRIVYDATGLSAAVFPAAPTLSNVSGAEPSATGSQSFVLNVPGHPAETIDIQAIGIGATVRNGAGAAASSVTGVHGDTIHIDWVASDEFSTPETFGVEMTGGVSAYFTVTTRAASAPIITAQPSGPAATSVGVAVTIDAAVTGYSSLQWRSNGVAIPGATSLPLSFTPAAEGSYSLDFVATSSEGASVTSSAHVVTALAAATRIQIPENVLTRSGANLGGQVVTVNIWADDSNRPGVWLRSATVTLAAAGNPTNIDSNENGAAGTVRWYSFPASSGLGRTEAFYQATVQSI